MSREEILNDFLEHLDGGDKWLAARMLHYINLSDFTKYVPPREDIWRLIIRGINRSIRLGLESSGQLQNSEMAEYILEQARSHKERGVSPNVFFGVLKYLRRVYHEFIKEFSPDRTEYTEYKKFVDFCFDRFETALCDEFAQRSASCCEKTSRIPTSCPLVSPNDCETLEEMKSEFVSLVSHELRTPLTSIKGALELINGGAVGQIESEARELLGIAAKNADRLARLIDDILDIEKLESGRIELNLTDFSAGEAIIAAFEIVRGQADKKRINLIYTLKDDFTVRSDKDKLTKIIVNILSNSIKNSKDGESVEASVIPWGEDMCAFEISDKGAGIPADKRPYIFDKFKQIDSSTTRREEGSGLGLAIAKNLTAKLGGSIWLESGDEAGTKMRFTVPLQKSVKKAEAEKENASRKPLVMILEDEKNTAALFETIISREGYAFETAHTIAQAREKLAGKTPDALILDIYLPDGDGLAYLNELRKNEKTSRLPVVIVSAKSPDEGALAQPFLIDWIHKPFDGKNLLKSVKKALPKKEKPVALIIEDDEFVRGVLKEHLKSMKIEALEASDGEQAVNLALKSPPDLIILDVMLPKMDGFQLIDALKRGSASRAPLLVYTALNLSAQERDNLTLGETKHLKKTTATTAEFDGAVKELLKGLLASA